MLNLEVYCYHLHVHVAESLYEDLMCVNLHFFYCLCKLVASFSVKNTFVYLTEFKVISGAPGNSPGAVLIFVTVIFKTEMLHLESEGVRKSGCSFSPFSGHLDK